MAGYSGTPLVKKLGIKPGFKVAFINAPPNFVKELDMPSDVTVKSHLSERELDFILVFVKNRTDLTSRFLHHASKIKPNGMFWVSWPKKSSGVKTDLTEDVIRAIALEAGLVDVKVCAVDEIWSGLKLVYRLADRGKLQPPSR